MECAHVAELLPWLLNGTLDAVVAEGVREHAARCARCADELEETRSVWALGAGHLPVSALVDYEFRAPSASLRRIVEAHLESCAPCADELELVRESHGDEAGLAPRATQPRSPGEAATRRSVAPAAAHLGRTVGAPALRSTRRATTWAAVLLAAVALGGWFQAWQRAELERAAGRARERSLAERLAQATAERRAERASPEPPPPQGVTVAPQLNPVVVELMPRLSEALRSADLIGGNLNILELPREATQVTLVLLANRKGSEGPHRVELRDGAGARVWSADGLEARTSGDFTLRLPVALLPAGRFRVRVLRATGAGGRHSLVAEYEIESRPPR